MIDPSKDKFAYFKDNIQTAEDKEFDASQYYYHREELSGKAGSVGSVGAGLGGMGGVGGMAGVGGIGMGMGAGMGAGSGLSGGGAGGLSLGTFQGMGGALGGGGGGGAAAGALDDGNVPPQGVFSAFHGGGMMGPGAPSFLGAPAPVPRAPLSGNGGLPPTHEMHRMASGRSFQLQAETKAPDMSDFPALSRANSWSMESNGESAATRAQTQASEFVIQKEDFPALSPFGAASSDKGTMPSSQPAASLGQAPQTELKRHTSFTSSASDSMALSQPSGISAGGNTSIGSRTGNGAGYTLANASNVHVGSRTVNGANAAVTSAATAAGAPGPSSNASLSGAGAFGPLHGVRTDADAATNGELDPSNTFGLLGMLHTVIRPSNDAKKNLLMGCDLTSLGLNLNSAEPLNPVFASPWSDAPLTKEPQFTLPQCYYNQPPALKTTHLSKFHLETLFYIFYSMPKDALQAYAAQELYSREWRYHSELKMWLKRATPADAALFANGASSQSSPASGATSATSLLGGSPSSSSSSSSLATAGAVGSMGSMGSIGSGPSAGSATTVGTANALGPQFLFFDTTTWERRVFTGNIQSISTGLMSEDDIRVKFSAAT